MIKQFEYSLDSLREKIALILNQQGAQFETGDFTDAAHVITIPKADLFSSIDNLIAQNTKLGSGSETCKIDISDDDIIELVNLKVKDITPDVSSVNNADTTSSFNIDDVFDFAKALSAYKGKTLKDETGLEFDDIALTSDENDIMVSLLTEGVSELAIKLEKILESISIASTAVNYKVTVSKNISEFTLSNLKTNMKLFLSHYIVAKWLDNMGIETLAKGHFGKCAEYIALCEIYTYKKYDSQKAFVLEAINQANVILDKLSPTYSYASSTHTIGLTVANNLSSSSVSVLTKLYNDFVVNYTTELWAQKLGLNTGQISAGIAKEMVIYTENKYDVLNASLPIRVGEIQNALSYVVSDVYTQSTSITFTVRNGGNFTDVSVQNITDLIKNYLINSVAFDFLVKVNVQASTYIQEANKYMVLLSKFSERKRDVIDMFLKQAAYSVYSHWMFAGKQLTKPVLYDESNIYAEQEITDDQGNTITIEAHTNDSTGKIYYYMLLSYYWDETSLTESLDNNIEHLLVNYVLKEYYGFKPEFKAEKADAEARYRDLLSDTRIILFTRQTNHATRRGSSWL